MFDVKYKHTSAPQLWFIPVSFACLILLGTVLFKLPWMVHPDQTISWVDSFFVSTSAVCITGLSPITIGDVLSFPGQIVLLFLVQMGGIGIFTSSLLMVVVVGQRFSLADEQVIQATIGKMQTVRPMDVFIYACFFRVCVSQARCGAWARTRLSWVALSTRCLRYRSTVS